MSGPRRNRVVPVRRAAGRRTRDRITVTVAASSRRWRRALPRAPSLCRRAALAALRAGGLPAPRVEVGVVLADDATVAALNSAYRGKAGPTNVLSFPAFDTPAPGDFSSAPAAPVLALGDVVLAFETTRREAAAARRPLADHMRHLVVHGMLHLLGYDHEDDRSADAMARIETGALAGLGVPDPYRPARPARGAAHD